MAFSETITNVAARAKLDAIEASITSHAASLASLETDVAAKQASDGDLTALAALSGTNTIYYRSAANTWSAVTIGTNLTFSGGTLSATGELGGTVAFSDITGKPTTLAGYGITDAAALSHTHAFSTLTSKPTTLAGYGITDAAAATHTHVIADTNGLQDALDDRAIEGHTHTFASLTSKPTTLAGYGITDGVTATELSLWNGTGNLTTVGNVTAGAWQAAIIAPEYLGIGTSITTKFLRGDGTWQTVSGGSGAWGGITGTITDQTDLVTYIGDEIDAAITGVGTVVTVSDPGADAFIKWNDSTNEPEAVSNATVWASSKTLSNTRITKRVATLTDGATVTIDADSYDCGKLTTTQNFTLAAPTGTPTAFQSYVLRLTGASAFTITWNAVFRATSGETLPAAITGSSAIDMATLIWNADDSKWDVTTSW